MTEPRLFVLPNILRGVFLYLIFIVKLYTKYVVWKCKQWLKYGVKSDVK